VYPLVTQIFEKISNIRNWIEIKGLVKPVEVSYIPTLVSFISVVSYYKHRLYSYDLWLCFFK